MKIEIKPFLAANPNYLIVAVLLAEDGNREPLIEIAGSEGEAYKILKNAKTYESFMAIHSPHDFPISLNHGEIVKMPERVAGMLFAGKTWFESMDSHLPARAFGDIFLKTLSKQAQTALVSKTEGLFQEFPVGPESPTLPSLNPSEKPSAGKKRM